MHTMTANKHKAERIDLKALVGNDRELLRQLIRTTLQEVLEAEMPEGLAAAQSERTGGRHGYRSGYYGRSLIPHVSASWNSAYRRIARDDFQLNYSSAISVRNAP